MTTAPTRVQAPAARRRRRRRWVEEVASGQHGVLSRRQLYAAGVTRWQVRAEVRAERWQIAGRQTVALHNGALDQRAREWVAVLEGGPRACLDGASALIASGLENFTVDAVRVSLPRGAKVTRVPGVDMRQTRRWNAADQVPHGVPRTRADVAAVRAALWARSDRQAALILTMTVQQGLATAEAIGRAMLAVRRDRRRAFIHAVLLDLLDGARALGELEVADACRRRGLPAPSRQVVRQGSRGTCYLDLYWEAWGLVVEVDGIQHAWAENIVSDALRQNDLSIQGDVVLRLPLLGLRVAPDDFFAQIERALVARGCPLAA